MRIVIINGYPQSGKDTFIDFAQKYIPTARIWTSTPAKEALKLLGWDGETKSPEVRKLLAHLKKLSVKHFDNSLTYVRNSIQNLEFDSQLKGVPLGVLFIHCREPREIDKLKKFFHAETLFIEREEASKAEFSNDSDRNVEQYKYDITLCNDGTLEELRDTAKGYVRYLKKSKEVR